MKAFLIRYLRRVLPKYRKTPVVRFVRRLSQVAFRLIENDNYDIKENGEQRVMEVLAKRLAVTTIFDVGANVGDYAAVTLAQFPSATTYSFEPVTSTYELLAKRFVGNQRVKTFNCGLSDKDAVVEFSVRKDDSTNSTSHPEASQLLNPGSERIKVQCILRKSASFAQEIGVSSIDFLKIDTEGNDWFVLEGFHEWLKAGRIKVIQFEYGMTCIFTKKLLVDHYAILRDHGYHVGKIFPSFVDFKNYDPLDEDFIGPNFLAVHESTGLQKSL
jgi:FkbM family methyltransferase